MDGSVGDVNNSRYALRFHVLSRSLLRVPPQTLPPCCQCVGITAIRGRRGRERRLVVGFGAFGCYFGCMDGHAVDSYLPLFVFGRWVIDATFTLPCVLVPLLLPFTRCCVAPISPAQVLPCHLRRRCAVTFAHYSVPLRFFCHGLCWRPFNLFDYPVHCAIPFSCALFCRFAISLFRLPFPLPPHFARVCCVGLTGGRGASHVRRRWWGDGRIILRDAALFKRRRSSQTDVIISGVFSI